MTSIPLLVCCDAGSAGRELLARRDMIMRWALTPAEAAAVIGHDPPRLVLVREEMADDVLRNIPAGIPAVVLLEADGWTRHQRYAEAGAAALVRASNRERILEAVSELTGLAFRVHPRVPLAEVLSFDVEGDLQFLEAVEISASGIAVRNLPNARVGTRVIVDLDFLLPARQLSALVVRFGQDDGQSLAGLAFDALTDDDRRALMAFIRERESMNELPAPENLTVDIGTYTLDLFQNSAADTHMFKDMISASMFPLEGALGPRMPSWLERVARNLTSLERTVLKGESAPPFIDAALDLRIALAQARAGAGGEAVRQVLGHRVLEFARTLANEGTGLEPEVLHQITEIRAALLVEAYAGPRHGANGTGEVLDDPPSASPSASPSAIEPQVVP